MNAFAAIVLAGGAARRLDGADKPGLEVGGTSLLERVLAAVTGAEPIVVVGPPRPVDAPVEFRREQPPGGGPVAAIAAGLAAIGVDRVVLLAADLPWIGPAVPRLLAALEARDAHGAEAAVLTTRGHDNHLAAAWRTEALRAALARLGDPHGQAARRLYAGARVVRIEDEDGWGEDCDSWDDLMQARDRADRTEDSDE